MNKRLPLLLTLFALATSAMGQINITFGKNRVQFHDFTWFFYETPHFLTYYDRKDLPLGKFAMQVAEQELSDIQNAMEYRLGTKMAVIVYTDLTDLKMSNIGNEEVFVNSGGVTKIVENKIFAYFNGDHRELRRQIREGIARVFMNNMLFGSNIQEIVQNAVLLNLPEWFTEGLVAYVAEDWNTDLDNRLRDLLLSGKYRNFEEFAANEPRFAGQALWYYIGQQHGKATVSNLLYLTRINRSVESGFVYVTGSTYNQILLAWQTYFTQQYMLEDQDRGQIKSAGDSLILLQKRKRDAGVQYYQAKLSPNGRYLAYASNDIGRFTVNIFDGKKKETIRVMRGGNRNQFQAPDYGYPLLAWSPSGDKLTIFWEKQDQIYCTEYVLSSKARQDTPLEGIERVLSAAAQDEKWYVLTAINGGYSGIYRYATASGLRRLTMDFYDYRDAVPAELNGRKGILFSSNRPDLVLRQERLDSILPLSTFDLFFYDLDTTSSRELVRITETPFANERNPMRLDGRHYAFLSDESGIYNRQMGQIDTVFAYNERIVKIINSQDSLILHEDSLLVLPEESIDTQYLRPVYKPKAFNSPAGNVQRGIYEQSIAASKGTTADLFLLGQKFYVKVQDSLPKATLPPKPTYFRGRRVAPIVNMFEANPNRKPKKQEPEEPDAKPAERIEMEESIEKTPAPGPDTGKIDIDNYSFQTDFEEVAPPKTTKPEPAPTPEKPIIVDVTPERAQEAVMNTKKKRINFGKVKTLPYKVRFRSDAVTTQLDNSLLFGGMEGMTGSSTNPFDYPPLGILLKTNIRDVFEDYRFEIGMRIPITFNGMEYFVVFENLKKRIDQKYSGYRKGESNLYVQEGPSFYQYRVKSLIHLLQAEFKYPFDTYRSMKAIITGRDDKFTFLATDTLTLEAADYSSQRLGLHLEYVFDNTIVRGENLLQGTRYKFYADFWNRMKINFNDGGEFRPSVGVMGVVGADFRHYQRLGRYSIFAFRAAGAMSFGSERILYYLGGMENWLNPKYNNALATPDPSNLAFQTVAANMRGFGNNIRNGYSYALINAELRVPVFNYLFRRTLKSAFLRNFQLTAFVDAGTAWQGLSPFSKNNPLNTYYDDTPPTNPIHIVVNYFRRPIVIGYGLGVRAMLFGYFFKFDYAWGIDTGIIQKPIPYFSIGYDF